MRAFVLVALALFALSGFAAAFGLDLSGVDRGRSFGTVPVEVAGFGKVTFRLAATASSPVATVWSGDSIEIIEGGPGGAARAWPGCRRLAFGFGGAGWSRDVPSRRLVLSLRLLRADADGPFPERGDPDVFAPSVTAAVGVFRPSAFGPRIGR